MLSALPQSSLSNDSQGFITQTQEFGLGWNLTLHYAKNSVSCQVIWKPGPVRGAQSTAWVVQTALHTQPGAPAQLHAGAAASAGPLKPGEKQEAQRTANQTSCKPKEKPATHPNPATPKWTEIPVVTCRGFSNTHLQETKHKFNTLKAWTIF